MKNLPGIILFLSFSLGSFGQKNKKAVFHFWDSTGKTVKAEKDALFFTRIQQLNDTCWQFQNYEMMGPLVSSEQYKDKEGKILHGRSSYMRIDGTLDSTGYFVNGKPDGGWLYFDNNGVLTSKKEYSMGVLLPTLNTDEKNVDKNNTTQNEADIEARFSDASNAWLMYLMKNLRYPEYALSKKIQGNIKLYFLVDPEGHVRDEILLKSVEYTLDNEAIRLLKDSPKWIPATRNGQRVPSYLQHAISFKTQ